MKLADVFEQDAVYDGKPNFMPASLVMNVLNHNAYGGTKQDLVEAKAFGEMENPKRFRVRVTIQYKEI